MADSANILSILASLAPPPVDPGITPTTFTPPPADNSVPPNVLQALAPPQGQAAPAQPPQPAPPSSSEDIYHAATADAPPTPTAPARARSSLLDKIGRVADVLATVGGATPLYQPTLDARQDRVLTLGDHDRKVSSENIKLATDKFDLGDKTNTRLGMAARGLQAIKAAGGDINTAWPELAARMQIDPQTAAAVAHDLQTNPNALDGLIAATTDPKYDQSKYGGTIVYGKDANGNLVAFQPSLGNDAARNILPEGVTPIDPQKFVDTGGAQVGVGTRSGRPTIVLPKSVSPDQANRSSTAITIAGMPARAQTGKGTPGVGDFGTANMLLDNIERGFNSLHTMQALPGEGSAVGQIAGAFGRSALGQKLGEQTGNAAAQKRLEIEKDINSLQSEMVKSLPASATRTKFEQEIQRRRMPDPARMSYATAQNVIADLRRMFAQAQKDAAAELAKKSPTPAARPAARPKPKSGWTIVKVQ